MTNENNEKQFSRRDFLKNSGMVAGGIAGGTLFGGLVTGGLLKDDSKSLNDNKSENSSDSTQNTNNELEFMKARMFFDRIEDYKTLEAACELIYPEDDNGPGAIELGAPLFIDKQLAMIWGINGNEYRDGPFEIPVVHSGLDKVIHNRNTRQSIFLDGLRTMNKKSHDDYDKPYYELDEKQQSEIMDQFVDSSIEMKTVESDGFFALLKQSVLEGVYSDPLYGGNKNMEGWKMRNFPGAQMSYGNYIDSEEFVQDQLDTVSLRDYQQ